MNSKHFKSLFTLALLLVNFYSIAQVGGSSQNCSNGSPTNCTPTNALLDTQADPIKKPKAGDELCSSTKLKTGFSCTQFTVDTATASTANSYDAKPLCWASNVNRDVWFWFIATAQDMTVSTDVLYMNLATKKNQPGYGLYDTQIQMYQSSNDTCTGTVTALSNGCDDDSGINGTNMPLQTYGTPKQAVVELTGLVPNKKYFIRVNAGVNAIGGNFCISAFDTYTPGSKPCEAQVVHPNNASCNAKSGNEVINYTSTNDTATSTSGIQPNAYVPIPSEYLACAGLTTGQYGTWTQFFDSLDTQEKITNLSGGDRVYTLFSSINCLHLTCLGSYTVANNANITVTAANRGAIYYILTTLLPGDMSQTFTTTLCVQNTKTCKALPTAKNLGGVWGAGGNVLGDADNFSDSYRVTQKQVYVSTTYCKNADGSSANGLCNSGPNVWFSWAVPSTYPAPGQAFFQVWNKNCTGGPLNMGIDVPMAFCAPSNGNCWKLSDPTTVAGKTGHLDWATNIGLDPNLYSCEYWLVLTGHNGEVCDFNFAVNDGPSLPGVLATQATTCIGGSPVTICGKNALSYEWSTGETTACIIVNPSVSTAYTVTATAGATGYDIAYVTVLPLPTATVINDYTLCTGTSPRFILTGQYAANPPYTFTYALNGGASQTVKSSGAIDVASVNKQSAVVTIPSGVNNYTIDVSNVQVSSMAGCAQNLSGVTATYDTTNIVLMPLPTATITGDYTVCKGTTAPSFTLTGENATAIPYVFTYNVNGGASKTVISSGTIDANGNKQSAVISVPTTTIGINLITLVKVKESSIDACDKNLSDTATLTVLGLPTATITGNATVCEGSAAPSFTLTGQNATTKPYIFTYTINGGTSQTVSSSGTSDIAIVSIPTNTAGPYTITLTNVQESSPNGCSQNINNNLLNNNSSIKIQIAPLPTATISGNSTVSVGASAVGFTLTGQNAVTKPYTFKYNIDGRTSQTVRSSGTTDTVMINVPTTTTGNYTINLTEIQDSSSLNCVRTLNSFATITVVPLPTATITGNYTVCKGAAAPSFTLTGQNAIAKPYIFTYTINGGANKTVSSSGASDTAVINIPTNIETTYTVVLTHVQESSSNNYGQNINNNSAIIKISPLPTATISGNATICVGAATSSFTLIGQSATIKPYVFTYNISGGVNQTVASSGVSDIATISIPANTDGNYTVNLTQVKESSTAGCNQNLNDSANLAVIPLPTAAITSDYTVCKGATAPSFTLTGQNATTKPYIFTYSINGGLNQTIASTGSSTIATINIPATTVGNYIVNLVKVQESSTLGCIQNLNDSSTLKVLPLPAAIVTGSDTVYIGSISPDFTITGQNAIALPYVFTYNINGGANQTITSSGAVDVSDNKQSALLSVPTNSVGTFVINLISVQESSTQNCEQDLTNILSLGNTATITVTDCFAYYITTYDTLQNTFSLTVDSITRSRALNYKWDFGDGATATSSHPSHVYANNGIYAVTLKIYTSSGDSCAYTHNIGKDNNGIIYRVAGFTLKVVDPNAITGVQRTRTENKCMIMPNPTNGLVNIIFSKEVVNVSVKITTIAGQKIMEQNNLSGIKFTFDLSNQASGMYLLEVNENGIITRSKIIKE